MFIPAKFCPYLLLLTLLTYFQGTFGSNKLLVLFFDGLRWDYIADNPRLFPGFHSLYKSGVRAHHLEPVFPTICYPNLYSFATGKYRIYVRVPDNKRCNTK